MHAEAHSQLDFAARRNHPTMLQATASQPIAISCDTCVMQATDACSDCVVSFIVAREPGDALIIDVGELQALRALADSGLVPQLRHRPGVQ